MNRPYHRSTLLSFSFSLIVLATPRSEAAVVASPSVVIFTSPDQSSTIALHNDGVALPASAILDSELIASGHDYRHMLSVEKFDGSVRVMPSASLEIGSYDLNIQTSMGNVSVAIYAPLSELPDYVAKIGSITGEAEAQIKSQLGLATSTAREEIQLNLAPVYYEGQTLSLSMPEPKTSGRTSLWFINGQLASEDSSSRSLTYTFKRLGEYLVTYMETELVQGAITLAASGRATTRVVEVPRVDAKVAVRNEILFHAPPGYNRYDWLLNGVAVSKLADYHYTFQAAGVHEVECLAQEPTRGPVTGYLRTRYSVVVE